MALVDLLVAVVVLQDQGLAPGSLVLEPATLFGDDLDAVHGGVDGSLGPSDFVLAGAEKGLTAGLEGAEDCEHLQGVLEDDLGGIRVHAAVVHGIHTAATHHGGWGGLTDDPADRIEIMRTPVDQLRGVVLPPAELV